MPLLNTKALREIALSALSSDAGGGRDGTEAAAKMAEVVSFDGLQKRRISGRRFDESSNIPIAPSTANNVLLALAVVEEQLRNARRENEKLRVANEKLASALTDAARHERETKRLAYHDELTGLPNRLLLRERLQQQIALAMQQQCQLAVLFIDLDGFKLVNDHFGHKVGDKLLTVAGTRIAACIRTDDTACRYGGDEFVVLLANLKEAEIAVQIAKKIRRRINQRYSIDTNELHITASIGLAVYPNDGEHSDSLLNHADASMYRSKLKRARARKDGRNTGWSAMPRPSIRSGFTKSAANTETTPAFANGGLADQN